MCGCENEAAHSDMIRSQQYHLLLLRGSHRIRGNATVCTTLEVLFGHESCLCKRADRCLPDPAHVCGKPHDVVLRLISVTKLIHDSLHVAEQLMGSESC